MLSSQSGVSDSPKPGCSGAMTSNFCASCCMNGRTLAPDAPCKTTSGLPAPPRISRMRQPRTASTDVEKSAMAEAWRFAGREQYERGFKGFKRCLALTASKEQGQLELDDMRDARKVVLAIRAAEEKAAANKIACPKSTEYKGVKLSKCLPDGTQCQACKAKYGEKHPS